MNLYSYLHILAYTFTFTLHLAALEICLVDEVR